MGWTQARNFQIKKTFNAEDENERGSNQQKQLDKLKNISISISITKASKIFGLVR